MLDKFSEELKEARINSGISLQQMSTRTRIDIKFLEAIDNGDFMFLPEPYVKAFLKDYAKMVGLDENITIQKFEAAKKGKLIEEIPQPQEDVEQKPAEEKTGEPVKPEIQSPVQMYDATPSETSAGSSPDATRRNIILGSIIGGSIIILGLVYLLFFRNGTEIVVAEKPIEEVIENNQQRYEEDTPVNRQAIPSDSISLTILSVDTTWIRILLDDDKSEEFILFPNSQKVLKTKNNYKLTIGNPHGIRFQLNNKPLNFTWDKGTVAYIQIDSSGLQYLRASQVRRQTTEAADTSNIQ
jgi:hypothetical protein